MNKLKVSLMVLALSFVASVSSAQTVNEINSKFNEGVTAYKAKDIDKAIVLMQEAVSLSETSGEDGANTAGMNAKKTLGSFTISKGKRLAGQKKFDESLVELKKAEAIFIELNNAIGEKQANNLIDKVYQVKAVMLNKAGDVDNAIIACQEGLKHNPKAIQLALFHAKLNYEKGDIGEAMKSYTSIYESAKTSRNSAKMIKAVNTALMSNASLAGKDGNTALANQNLDLLLANDTENELAHLQRIQIYNSVKDYNSVIKYGDLAVNAQTNNANKSMLNYIIGAAYQVNKDVDKAVAHYNLVTEGQYVANAKKIVASLTKK